MAEEVASKRLSVISFRITYVSVSLPRMLNVMFDFLGLATVIHDGYNLSEYSFLKGRQHISIILKTY